MITTKPIPADGSTILDLTTGWLHDCGAFVSSPTQPSRCGVCWSANHTRWAFNGQWQKAYVVREEVVS
jgi:hypothetical protein